MGRVPQVQGAVRPRAPAWRALLVVVAAATLVLLAGCQSNTRAAPHYVGNEIAPGVSAPAAAPIRIDVGVGVFEDGVVDLDPDQVETTPAARRAEAHYMPQVLAETLEARGGFGQVRVIPRRLSEMDVWVDGRILRSTGAELELAITVSDAKGRVWYTKEYEHEVNRYVYDPDPTLPRRDPFQAIYEDITDDLVRELARRSPGEIAELRTIAQLQFAQRFAPEQYGDYLARDEDGLWAVRRLPATEDPVFARLADVRQRDRLFTDRIGQYYHTYVERMTAPYDDWRRASHEELVEMRKLKSSEIVRKVGGALAVLGGLAAVVASGDGGAQVAGAAGMVGGAALFASGMDRGARARLHAEALTELAQSMGGNMRPHHITLHERTVTLSGTVEEQYAQWRGLLRELYAAENGGAEPQLPLITAEPPPDAATTPAAPGEAPR